MKALRHLVFASVFLLGSIVHAEPIKILFFYPGGQGSQSVAQPILDEFAKALKKASGDQIDANIFYVADKSEGLKFIQAEKPAAAIFSLDAYEKYGSQVGANVLAKTLQLPSGDGTDQFFIVGKKDGTLPASGELSLLSTQPLEKNFVSQKLFPKLSTLNLTIQPTQNAVGELRAIGDGKKTGFVLLDQFEYSNISKLKTPWASNLTALSSSEKVSSAPFVSLPSLPESLKAPLLKALLGVSQDSSAKETLQTLRIKGFKAS